MKKLIACLILGVFSLTSMSAYDIRDSYYNYENSFRYVRVGGYTLLHYPLGVEFAFGERHRSGEFGYGPLMNISVSELMLPAVSLKFESLFYPKSFGGGYVGIMPGIGVAYANGFIYNNPSYRWIFLPTFEFVIGNESISYCGKREFYYVSISPYFTLSFNYGWGF